ncbi:Uncharacterised protein [Chlamydia trachomatis]|nr:Uncharacterised protein [Chlamydia trachomatis]
MHTRPVLVLASGARRLPRLKEPRLVLLDLDAHDLSLFEQVLALRIGHDADDRPELRLDLVFDGLPVEHARRDLAERTGQRLRRLGHRFEAQGLGAHHQRDVLTLGGRAARALFTGHDERLAQRLDRHGPRLAHLHNLHIEEVRTPNEVGDEDRRGMQVDLGGRGHLLDAARIHDDDPIGHRHRLGLVVRDVHGGDAQALLHPADLDAHLDAQFRVEIRQRFIEEQHLGAHDHRAGEGDALLLAARQLRGRAVGHRREIHRRERNIDGLVELGLGHALEFEPVGDILSHRQVREEGIGLEDHRHGALIRRDAHHVLPVEHHLARGRVLETGDHAQGRRLSASRRPEQSDELAGQDVEVDVIDGGHGILSIAEGLRQFDEREAARRSVIGSCGLGGCGRVSGWCGGHVVLLGLLGAHRPAPVWAVTDLSRTSRLVRPMTVMTMMMRIVQNANALPKRPASTSARICDVMIFVWGVVMNTIGDSVVIDLAKA